MKGAAAPAPPTVLFVAYGSGHIKMVVPVAKALAARGGGRPVVLALTTAAPVARDAGLQVVQFKDFVTPGDEAALALGRELVGTLGGPIEDREETIAYLGLSMSDLVASAGAGPARQAYAKFGRQAFLPLPTLERILRVIQPHLVVATNSPRAERAALLAARLQGIGSVALVDLFAIDELEWLQRPDYADHLCVLNEAVRQSLIAAGRLPQQVTATGNPGFDALNDPPAREQGRELRASQSWQDRRVILWPTQVEPAFHPFNGKPGDPSLPERALREVVAWVRSRQDSVLVIRARAGEALPGVPPDPRIVVSGQDWPLAPLLHASDLVVTLNSTVGLEGHLAGCRLIQVLGSVFDQAMPLARYAIADEAVDVAGIGAAIGRWADAPRRDPQSLGGATARVLGVLEAFLPAGPAPGRFS